jgi:sigma-B regulation protein RsbU (phosphoserine phosphatase)
MAVLRALKGLNPGQLFPLESQTAVLGRHPDCDIVLDVKAVSRQHVRISHADGDYYVEDLHSRNGTYLNEQLVEGRRLLSDGDQLRICDLVFVFHKGPPEAAVTAWEQAQGVEATAMMVDDERVASSSTVMSKVDISSGAGGLRLAVNAEVKLKALIEIGQHVGKALGLSQVLPKLLDSLFSIFLQADRGFIVLRDRQTGKLVPKAVHHRRDNTAGPIRISRTIVNSVMQTKEAILSADAATDSRFDMAESIVDFQIHSIMCAPLIDSSGQPLGVIQIDTLDQRNRFCGEDLEVLASVACQAAVIVENAQLHEIAVQERVMSRELALAHEVQQGFLPAAPPLVTGYEFFDYYEPANQLGGDYFDYIPLSGGRMAIVLADVSGKGISAALLVARLSAETRYCLASEPNPSAAVARLNKVFCENRWEGRFVTGVMAVLDPVRHEVTIVNAGHMSPLLRRPSGEIEAVGETVTGLPLGVDAAVVYGQHSLTLAPGESLTMYTDGVTDALNAAQQFYGFDRLRGQLQAGEAAVHSLGRKLLDDVQRFVGNQPQTDDMCVACFGRAV